MTKINLIKEAGAKIVHFEGLEFQHYEDGRIPAQNLTLGDYDGTGATVNNPFLPTPMTKAQYDDIVAFKGEATSRVAGDPYTAPKTLTERFGILTNLVTGLLDRVILLERQAGAIEFDEWSMKGTILTGKLGTRNVCRINLGGDFDIDQVEYNDVAEDDGERLLTISKNGVTRKFHTFTSNDLSAITDQAMNPQPGTIVSNVPKPKT